MSEQKYLISIAIGPVQDFIASARRSRDLWFGSWLLSELSKAAAKSIVEQNGELIFPKITKDNDLEESSDFNVVNKILAIVEKPDENFDENLQNLMKARLERIYKSKFREIKDNLRRNGLTDNYFKEEVAIAQIEDLTELYWAAVPYNPSEYTNCRNNVELLLNARKATRDFNRVTWGDNVPKSSLDGQRESVIEDKAFDDENNFEKIQKIFHLRNKERLCGVGVLKRLGEENLSDKFLSTSHVASLPFIQGAGLANFDKYANELSKLVEKDSGFNRQDGQIIYKSRLKDFVSDNSLEDAEKLLDKFLKNNPNSKLPSPYFALLQADGDRMGTVIDNQENPTDHKELSEALSKFADNDVKIIVQNYQGCLIYSGGDDVLAMLPLHTVLDCTRELANEFAKKLNGFSDKDGNKPTLSAGIAICHHTEPLQDSLTTMRNAEKEAKSVKGKNALAIILSKRSGADTTVKGSWKDDNDTDKPFDERLKWFIYLHLAELFPSGVAYELRDLWLRFRDETDTKGKIKIGFEEIVKKEAFRIIKRKKTVNSKKSVSDDVLNKLKDFIENSTLSIESLAKEIIVAKEFAKAYKQSGMTAKEFAKENNLQEGGNDNDE